MGNFLKLILVLFINQDLVGECKCKVTSRQKFQLILSDFLSCRQYIYNGYN